MSDALASNFQPPVSTFALRRDHFPDEITFHAPGLKRFKTSEYVGQEVMRFASISVTGTECALACEHCKTHVLEGMTALPRFDGSLFDLCAELAERGARGVLISGGCDKRGRVPLLRHIPEPPPVIGHAPEFSLVDSDGHPFGSAELSGQAYVVSFFFTSCRSICPAIMHGMLKLQNGFDERGIQGIRLVSISVDPEHDTPGVLHAYGADLGVDPARWILLTGDPERVRALVVEGFKTPLETAPATPTSPIDIAHTGKVVLVDGSGAIRGYYGTDEMGLDEVFNRAQHVARK